MRELPREPDTRGLRAVRSEENEVALLARIEQGDREAFAQLYRAYFSRLARFLDRMTRSPAVIEEVINDTMLVVWQKAATFNHTCKVSTWIFGIAYRKALKAVASMDEPEEADADDEPGCDAAQPEVALSLHQLQQQVARALDCLPPTQRAVVNLAYYHGMGYEEIAGIMDCPVNTVKTRMFSARSRLRALLGSDLEVNT
ncbi:MAG TPA: sigma-70 family RNA polymerase sigma factor [Telluria sp.]|nr:sigma-70 family RNA polymerase sigma factor [Telluria sp.]